MIAEDPARGILMRYKYSDLQSFHVVCDCHENEHSHEILIESQNQEVSVTISTIEHTDFWSESFKKKLDIENNFFQKIDWFWKDLFNGLIRKIKLTWILWTRGSVKYEACLLLNEQVALNYAEALKKAIEDVKKARDIK